MPNFKIMFVPPLQESLWSKFGNWLYRSSIIHFLGTILIGLAFFLSLIIFSCYELSYANPVKLGEVSCNIKGVAKETHQQGKTSYVDLFGGFLCGDQMVSYRWSSLQPGILDGSKQLWQVHYREGIWPFRTINNYYEFRSVE